MTYLDLPLWFFTHVFKESFGPNWSRRDYSQMCFVETDYAWKESQKAVKIKSMREKQRVEAPTACYHFCLMFFFFFSLAKTCTHTHTHRKSCAKTQTHTHTEIYDQVIHPDSVFIPREHFKWHRTSTASMKLWYFFPFSSVGWFIFLSIIWNNESLSGYK